MGEGDNNSSGEGGEKSFSQADMDRVAAKSRAEGYNARKKETEDYEAIRAERDKLRDAGKSDADKARGELDRAKKDLEKANNTVKELTTFKTETELQKLKTERCEALKLPAKYAGYATGTTQTEIDESLKKIHADFGARDIGAGGGGESGDADKGFSKKFNKWIRS